MAIIVRYFKNGSDYILLGAGFGAFMSSRPSALLGNLAPADDSGTMQMVAVCDYEGQIAWIPSDLLEVVSIDGRTPDEVLDEYVRQTRATDPPPPSG